MNFRRIALATTSMSASLLLGSGNALAACNVSPPPSSGVNTVTCNSLTPGANENISTLAGNDVLFMQQGTLGTLDLGTGNDTANVTGAGTTISILIMGNATATGVDTTTISNGTVTTLTQGAESHVLTVSGSGIVSSVDQGAGADGVSISGGSIGSLLQGSGIDTLTITGGSVTSANQGSEADSLIMSAGSLGAIDQGSSADSAVVSGGTVGPMNQGTGNDSLTVSGAATNIGAVDQSDGVDSFSMTSGTLASLDQGADLDTAVITGGWIVGTFLDGDDVQFDGGRIGSVNLVKADNVFEMTGLTGSVQIDLFLNAEEGDDIFNLLSGTIGTYVNSGNGDDTITIGGTAVGSYVEMEDGNNTLNLSVGSVGSYVSGGSNVDTINMTGGSITTYLDTEAGEDDLDLLGGTIGGDVLSGAGADSVTISGTAIAGNLDTGSENDTIALTLGSVANIVAGTGNDSLTWSGGTLSSFSGGDGSDSATVSTTNYTGTQQLNGGDDVASGDGFIDTLNLNGLNVTANGGNLLNWELLNLNATSLTLSNNAITVGTLNVNTGSTLASTGALTVTGNLSTAAGGTWQAPSGGTVTGTFNNAGTVDLRDGAVGDVLVVGGDYVGGGTVGLDVDTGATTSDTLSIAGDVTGAASQIALNNLSLSGSYTGDGPGAGIALVNVAGATDAGDFALSGGPVVAGGFLYNLSLEADGTFYLQSTVRGGAVAAATGGLLISDVGQTFLGTRHERMGEQELAETSNIWGRAIGSFASEDVSATGIGTINTDTDITGLQAGMDLIAHEASSGSRTRIGVYGGLSWLSADASTAGAGGASAATSGDGHVAALYASYDNASGWYADAVLQGEWLDLAAGDAAGGTLATEANGWLASLEMGTTFQLTNTSWLEPQAQVIYGRNSTDAAVDSAGVLNQFSDDELLVGRIGARLKSTQKLGDGEGGFVTGWLKANLWADAMADDQTVSMTSTAGTTLSALDRKSVWADVGIGFDIQANQWMTLFADGDVSVGLDGSYQAFGGKAGARLAF